MSKKCPFQHPSIRTQKPCRDGMTCDSIGNECPFVHLPHPDPSAFEMSHVGPIAMPTKTFSRTQSRSPTDRTPERGTTSYFNPDSSPVKFPGRRKNRRGNKGKKHYDNKKGSEEKPSHSGDPGDPGDREQDNGPESATFSEATQS